MDAILIVFLNILHITMKACVVLLFVCIAYCLIKIGIVEILSKTRGKKKQT